MNRVLLILRVQEPDGATKVLEMWSEPVPDEDLEYWGEKTMLAEQAMNTYTPMRAWFNIITPA